MSAKVVKESIEVAKQWVVANKRTAFTFAMILLAVVVVNIYRVYMVRIDEDMVDAYYQKHINASRSFDAGTLCNLLDKDYKSIDTVVGPEGTETLAFNKAEACEAGNESMRMMWELIKKTKAEPEMKYTIASVKISSDGRKAEVEIRGSLKIGKTLDMQFTGTETLIRRYGDVRSIGGRSRSVVKVGKL